MANKFLPVFDKQMWILVQPSPNSHGAGVSMCSDLRNDIFRIPYVYQLATNAILNRFNIVTKGWHAFANPGAPTVAAGSAIAHVPSRGLQGTIAAGSTTTSITTSTVITSAFANQFASMGGTGVYGYKIRIIGNRAGGSGKTEEKFIIASTSGTTPTFILDTPLTFTPGSGDAYEIYAGRVMMLGSGAIAANSWRAMDVTNSAFSNLGNTNLPTIGTDSAILVLDEQFVPYNNFPGEGLIAGEYKYCTNINDLFALTATATAAGTITGQASGGDSGVVANEYRNFQIRIVEDTTTPTAVGQRRIIASHTAGASPVYTLGANWTVTPSSTCKFVIEYPNLILLRTAANTTVYTYNYGPDTVNNGTNSILTNAWSTTYFGTAPAANAGGNFWMPSCFIQPDVQNNSRHSFMFFARGSGAVVDLLDISGSITGLWTSTIPYETSSGLSSFPNGSCGTPGFSSLEGRYFYINAYNQSVLNQIFRFDVKNRNLAAYVPTDWIQTGAAAVGNRFVSYAGFDNFQPNDVLLLMVASSNITQEIIVQA